MPNSAASDSLVTDPTFLVTAMVFGLALVLAGGAAVVRAIRAVRLAASGHATGGQPCGRVSTAAYRGIDLIGVGWLLAIYTWLALTQIAIMAGMDASERTLRIPDVAISILFQGFMGLTVIIVMWPRVRPADWLGLRPQCWRPVLLLAPVSVAIMWIVFAALQAGGYVDWIESLGVETTQDSVRILQTERSLPLLVLMSFAAVVVAPVCEEVVFRGYLYPVAKRFWGPAVGALASSLAFAAAHASLVAMLPLALFGLLLAWLYERTGTIWAPIAAHACFNGATVAIQLAIR